MKKLIKEYSRRISCRKPPHEEVEISAQLWKDEIDYFPVCVGCDNADGSAVCSLCCRSVEESFGRWLLDNPAEISER